jgi:hypothetical protein
MCGQDRRIAATGGLGSPSAICGVDGGPSADDVAKIRKLMSLEGRDRDNTSTREMHKRKFTV